MTLTQGRIVWVGLPDSAGNPPVKDRPAVVLTPTAAIDPAGTVLVAAVTTAVGLAPAAVTVPLPWQTNGHPRTRFRQPCEAVSTWLGVVPVADIRRVGGVVPGRELFVLLGMVKTPPPPPPPPTSAD